MQKPVSSLLWMLVSCAVCADEPPTAPRPPAPSLAPPVAAFPLKDDEAPLPLADVRQHLQKLKAERDALDDDRMKAALFFQDTTTSEGADIAKLRMRLGSLLATIGTKKSTAPPLAAAPVKPPPKADTAPVPLENPSVPPPTPDQTPPKTPASDPGPDRAKVLDPVALAQNLFQNGNYQGALQAYRMLPQEGLKAEERGPLQYMIAICLRKLGKTDEAANVFREVANSRGDEHLAACAQWQLNLMRWQRETSDQISRVRQRRLELEKQP